MIASFIHSCLKICPGAILAVCVCVETQGAVLTMTLDGDPGSSIVNVLFAGSSIAAQSRSGGIINFGWNFLPDIFDPFPAQITGSDFGAFSFTSGAAASRNVTRGTSTAITGIWLQDSSNSPLRGWERFGVLEESGNTYTQGDLIEWSGAATIDLSTKGLTFGDLRPGTTGPVSANLEILQGQLVIVPEPSTAILWLAAAAWAYLFHRVARRRSA